MKRIFPLATAAVVLGMVLSGHSAARSAAPAAAPTAAPEKIERGRYLANHVTLCITCHSERNWTLYSGPVVPGTEGKGAKLDYLGLNLHSSNITPAGIGSWTDKEVLRALTEGVGKKGEPLHSFLPGGGFRHLALEDAEAIVAYLRTLPSIANQVPKAAAKKAVKPQPYRPEPRPNPADTVATGKYLMSVGDCRLCHGENLAGGQKYQIPGRPPIVSLNLTPIPGSVTVGSRSTFIGRFKAYRSDGARRLRAPADTASTVMPWTDLARMSDEDLGAIYDYLRTVKPVAAAAAKP